MIISGQKFGRKLPRVFTSGDGCCLPIQFQTLFFTTGICRHGHADTLELKESSLNSVKFPLILHCVHKTYINFLVFPFFRQARVRKRGLLERGTFQKSRTGYLRKSLLTPQITRNHPKPQIFPKIRRCPEIPQEFPLNSY